MNLYKKYICLVIFIGLFSQLSIGCSSPEEDIKQKEKTRSKKVFATDADVVNFVAGTLDAERNGVFKTLEYIAMGFAKQTPDVTAAEAKRVNALITKKKGTPDVISKYESLLLDLKSISAKRGSIPKRITCFPCFTIGIPSLIDSTIVDGKPLIISEKFDSDGISGGVDMALDAYINIHLNDPFHPDFYVDAIVDATITIDKAPGLSNKGKTNGKPFLETKLYTDIDINIEETKRLDIDIVSIISGGGDVINLLKNIKIDVAINGNIEIGIEIDNYGKDKLDGILIIQLENVYISLYPDGKNDEPFCRGGFLGIGCTEDYGTIKWSFIGKDGPKGSSPFNYSGVVNLKRINKPYFNDRSGRQVATSFNAYELEVTMDGSSATATRKTDPSKRMVELNQTMPNGPAKSMSYLDYKRKIHLFVD